MIHGLNLLGMGEAVREFLNSTTPLMRELKRRAEAKRLRLEWLATTPHVQQQFNAIAGDFAPPLQWRGTT